MPQSSAVTGRANGPHMQARRNDVSSADAEAALAALVLGPGPTDATSAPGVASGGAPTRSGPGRMRPGANAQAPSSGSSGSGSTEVSADVHVASVGMPPATFPWHQMAAADMKAAASSLDKQLPPRARPGAPSKAGASKLSGLPFPGAFPTEMPAWLRQFSTGAPGPTTARSTALSTPGPLTGRPRTHAGGPLMPGDDGPPAIPASKLDVWTPSMEVTDTLVPACFHIHHFTPVRPEETGTAKQCELDPDIHMWRVRVWPPLPGLAISDARIQRESVVRLLDWYRTLRHSMMADALLETYGGAPPTQIAVPRDDSDGLASVAPHPLSDDAAMLLDSRLRTLHGVVVHELVRQLLSSKTTTQDSLAALLRRLYTDYSTLGHALVRECDRIQRQWEREQHAALRRRVEADDTHATKRAALRDARETLKDMRELLTSLNASSATSSPLVAPPPRSVSPVRGARPGGETGASGGPSSSPRLKIAVTSMVAAVAMSPKRDGRSILLSPSGSPHASASPTASDGTAASAAASDEPGAGGQDGSKSGFRSVRDRPPTPRFNAATPRKDNQDQVTGEEYPGAAADFMEADDTELAAALAEGGQGGWSKAGRRYVKSLMTGGVSRHAYSSADIRALLAGELELMDSEDEQSSGSSGDEARTDAEAAAMRRLAHTRRRSMTSPQMSAGDSGDESQYSDNDEEFTNEDEGSSATTASGTASDSASDDGGGPTDRRGLGVNLSARSRSRGDNVVLSDRSDRRDSSPPASSRSASSSNIVPAGRGMGLLRSPSAAERAAARQAARDKAEEVFRSPRKVGAGGKDSSAQGKASSIGPGGATAQGARAAIVTPGASATIADVFEIKVAVPDENRVVLTMPALVEQAPAPKSLEEALEALASGDASAGLSSAGLADNDSEPDPSSEDDNASARQEKAIAHRLAKSRRHTTSKSPEKRPKSRSKSRRPGSRGKRRRASGAHAGQLSYHSVFGGVVNTVLSTVPAAAALLQEHRREEAAIRAASTAARSAERRRGRAPRAGAHAVAPGQPAEPLGSDDAEDQDGDGHEAGVTIPADVACMSEDALQKEVSRLHSILRQYEAFLARLAKRRAGDRGPGDGDSSRDSSRAATVDSGVQTDWPEAAAPEDNLEPADGEPDATDVAHGTAADVVPARRASASSGRSGAGNGGKQTSANLAGRSASSQSIGRRAAGPGKANNAGAPRSKEV